MRIKTVLKYLIFGIQWGCMFFVVVNIILLLTVGDKAYLSADNFIKSAFASMLAGIGGASTSIVYTFESWSFKKQVSVHFIVGLSIYFLSAYIGNWFKFSFDFVFIITILLAVAVFFIIWFVFYLITKNDEKSINNKLKKIQNNNK